MFTKPKFGFAVLMMIALVSATLGLSGCASNDGAIRTKSQEFTAVNWTTWDQDKAATITPEKVTEVKAVFANQGLEVLETASVKLTGDKLKARAIAIVGEQQKLWEAARKPDLPAEYVRLTVAEFDSQTALLAGK